MGNDYLATADVWTVLDLIVAEFTSDPTSTACFDRRIVDRAIQLNRLQRARPTPDQDLKGDEARVQRIVGNIRGAFSTTGGVHPVFQRSIDVETVVRFVLLRAADEPTGRLYCASCGDTMPAGAHLYVGSRGDLLHQVNDGTAACGPVLRAETPASAIAPPLSGK